MSSLSLYSQLGLGIGGIFITALLVYLLGYLQVVEAGERDYRHLRMLLIATSVPLQFVFAGMIAFEFLRMVAVL